jgi:type II secretory pathway pseudopilin PulG
MIGNFRIYKNQSGFTIIEILISGILGVIILGVTMYIFTKQQDVLEEENASTNIRAKGRHAIKVLAKELKAIGFGLPPTEGFVAPNPVANGSTITYRANLDSVRASTPPSATDGGSTADTDIDVVANGGDFSDNDNIIIYNPSFGDSELNTVSGTPTSTNIPLGSGLVNDYSYGANSKLVTINKYNNIVIDLNGTNIRRTVDGGTSTIIISDVSDLTFDFFGVTQTNLVSTIGITITLQDSSDSSITQSFSTDITLRN